MCVVDIVFSTMVNFNVTLHNVIPDCQYNLYYYSSNSKQEELSDSMLIY